MKIPNKSHHIVIIIIVFILTILIPVVSKKHTLESPKPNQTYPTQTPDSQTELSLENIISEKGLSTIFNWQEDPIEKQLLSLHGIGWEIGFNKKTEQNISVTGKLPGKEFVYTKKVKTEQELNFAGNQKIFSKEITGNDNINLKDFSVQIPNSSSIFIHEPFKSQSKIIQTGDKIQVISVRITPLQNIKEDYPYDFEYRVFISKPLAESDFYTIKKVQTTIPKYTINLEKNTITSVDKKIHVEDLPATTDSLKSYAIISVEESTNPTILMIKTETGISLPSIYLFDLTKNKAIFVGHGVEVQISPSGKYIVYNSRSGDAGSLVIINLYDVSTGKSKRLSDTTNVTYSNFKWLTDTTLQTDYMTFDDNPYGVPIDIGQKIFNISN